jgi:hypothetical protein
MLSPHLPVTALECAADAMLMVGSVRSILFNRQVSALSGYVAG